MRDEVADISAALARPDTRPWSVSRRRFLQLVAATAGGIALAEAVPAWARHTAAATPLGPADGVLVLVNLQGGNDALSTLVPFGSPAYYDHRGPVAVAAHDVLAIDNEVGLHPSLPYLKSRWDDGGLAIVQGVGDPSLDRSHFTAMARWMSASDALMPTTGWLGRYLDALGAADEAFTAVTISAAVPLTLVGRQRAATALGDAPGAFGTSPDANLQRLARAVRDLAAQPSGRGPLADALTQVGRDMVDVNTIAAPLYQPDLSAEHPVRELQLAARLLNADLGVRVINVDHNGFDTHATQLGYHADLLRRVDTALAQFFATLRPELAGRVTVLIASEFGRALTANASGGTDHGTAGAAMLIGSQVRGGRHGQLPSLAGRARGSQLPVAVDHRSVFATVLARWLGADDTAILGRAYELLDLFRAGPNGTASKTGGRSTSPGTTTTTGYIEPIHPVRLLDTRDGTGSAIGALPAGQSIDVNVPPPTSRQIPTGVILNVTATAAIAAGFVTVWAAGRPRPVASCLNFVPGEDVPNLVAAELGADGAISLYNSAGATHLVADLVAYVGSSPGGTFIPVEPFRLLDTRAADEPLVAGATRRIAVAGQGGVLAHGVSGVIANVTVTEPTAPGYLTVWPAGDERPLASNLNFKARQTVPNMVVAKLGDGAIDVVASAGSAHVVIDVIGVLVNGSTGAQLHTTTPTRILDTRDDTGGGPRLGPGTTLDLAVGGVAGVPNDAQAVVINLTAAQPDSVGWVTVWPAGQARPATSSLNLTAGRDVANLVVAMLGVDGVVKLYNSRGTTDLVADLVGWFA